MADDDLESEALETIIIDVYPWAVPTEEQMRWFDGLPVKEKRRIIAEANEEAFNSGVSDRSTEDILAEVLARPAK